MQIYAEYLFVENFAAGIIILLLLGRITGKKITGGRLVEGGIFCGLYSFIIFWDTLDGVSAIFLKLLFSVFIVVNSFPDYYLPQKSPGNPLRKLKAVFKLTVLFYLISFAMGGMVIAGIYISGAKGVTRNTLFYTGDITYFNVFAGLLISYFFICFAIDWLKKKRVADSIYKEAVVAIEGRTWTLKAMLDTGNMLKDPVMGRPVCVLWGEHASEIAAFAGAGRFCIIPYHTLGKNGTLRGIRADRLTVGRRTIDKIVLAIYGEEMCKDGCEKYDLILNRAILEGGVEIDD